MADQGGGCKVHALFAVNAPIIIRMMSQCFIDAVTVFLCSLTESKKCPNLSCINFTF